MPAAAVEERRARVADLIGDRPLSARSVLASALLGADEPRLRVGELVGVASLFGISGGAARTCAILKARAARTRCGPSLWVPPTPGFQLCSAASPSRRTMIVSTACSQSLKVPIHWPLGVKAGGVNSGGSV